jgi:hypothetical protein
MHRPALPLAAVLALVALLASAPAAAAVSAFDADAGLEPGQRRAWPLDGGDGDAFTFDWRASGAAVDVFVVKGQNESAVDSAAPSDMPFQALNQSSGSAHVTLSGAGPWVLVVDNTPRPPGGAAGDAASTVHLSVQPVVVDVPTPVDSGSDSSPEVPAGEEPPTLWNTLMFDAHHWTAAGVGFASVALWMILLGAAACYGFASPLPRLATLSGWAALFTALWALPPHVGPLTEIGPPAIAGLALGWAAVKWTSNLRDGLQLAFVAAVLGAFAGVVVAYGVRHLWSDPGMLVLGGRRFTDVLFTLPGFAVAGVLLFKLVPDVVHALDEANREDHEPRPEGVQQGEAFTVNCLRCGTAIAVDRSMKRFRVATDRYEFACPNCQYWMEWAEPGSGAAAA